MNTVKERRKKSVKLEPNILKEFRKYVGKFDTMLDCADDLGVHFNTIPRILGLGSCSPDVKEKIVNKLNIA